ncbi:MAG: hypothetical protein ABI696_16895 [Rubrivivax sp.]
MSLLDHPAVQSLALPAALTALAMALLAASSGAAGRGRAAFGPALALLASLALLPGFRWPALAAAQKLPWIVAAALGAAVVVHALQRGVAPGASARQARAGWPAWAAAFAVWAGASVWLAPAMPATRTSGWLAALAIGAAGLAALVWPAIARRQPATAPAAPAGGMALAALAVVAGGLALLAATGGSLLLGQLAGMLASCAGVAAAVARWRRAAPVPAAALTPLVIAGLTIALALAGRVALLPLALLALALAAPLVIARARWAAQHPRAALVAAGLLAARPVAAALAITLTGAPAAADAGGAAPGAPADDPYYTPRWKKE